MDVHNRELTLPIRYSRTRSLGSLSSTMLPIDSIPVLSRGSDKLSS
jgi:hypothetical protein